MFAIIDPRDNQILDWRDTREAAQAYARQQEASATQSYRAHGVTLKIRAESNVFSRAEHNMAVKGFAYLAKTQSTNGLRKIIRNLDGFKRSDIVFDACAYEADQIRKA